MKRFVTMMILFALAMPMVPDQRVSAQSTGTLTLTVSAPLDNTIIGDEIKFTVSTGDATGLNLSAFSFRIQLSDGLGLKAGSSYIIYSFREASGMFMSSFDETPSLMVSGFGSVGYNGGPLNIAEFTCVATSSGTLKADLFDVMFYNADNMLIPTKVIPATVTVAQKTSNGNNIVNPPNDNPSIENENKDSGNIGTANTQNNNVDDIKETNSDIDVSYTVQNENVATVDKPDGFANDSEDAWVNPFADVNQTDWFYEFVATAHINGLMVGTSSTTFSPTTPVTRAMFTRILANIENKDLSEYTNSRFTDVPSGQWYTSAVEWAADVGIVAGIGNNMFDPNASITREQMAVMINNYVSFKGLSPSFDHTPPTFADEDQISSWAVDAVRFIQLSGLVSGRPGNLFDPKASASRAEIATIFTRFVDYVL